MTYRELRAELRAVGVSDDETEARLLFRHELGENYFAAVAEDRDVPSPFFSRAVEERRKHRPLQYILGLWPFYKEIYEVKEGCLIPRPDTEILVETAVRELPEHCFFADLCAGSGCVGISVLASRPDTRCVGVDIAPDLVDLCMRNASRNGVSDRYEARTFDVLGEDIRALFEGKDGPTCLLSNPPYIPTRVIPTLSYEVQKEPKLALDGGEDGLVFYKRLIRLCRDCLRPGNLAMFEIGYDQGRALLELSRNAGFDCEIIKDLSDLDRVAKTRIR